MKRTTSITMMATLLFGCGGDAFTASLITDQPDAADDEKSAPDALPDSGGAESIGQDAGGESHDTGSDVASEADTQPDALPDSPVEDVISEPPQALCCQATCYDGRGNFDSNLSCDQPADWVCNGSATCGGCGLGVGCFTHLIAGQGSCPYANCVGDQCTGTVVYCQ